MALHPIMQAALLTGDRAFRWDRQAAVEEALQDMLGEDTGAAAKHVLERLERGGYLTRQPAVDEVQAAYEAWCLRLVKTPVCWDQNEGFAFRAGYDAAKAVR